MAGKDKKKKEKTDKNIVIIIRRRTEKPTNENHAIEKRNKVEKENRFRQSVAIFSR